MKINKKYRNILYLEIYNNIKKNFKIITYEKKLFFLIYLNLFIIYFFIIR